jgi:hypothetical protein
MDVHNGGEEAYNAAVEGQDSGPDTHQSEKSNQDADPDQSGNSDPDSYQRGGSRAGSASM